MNVSYRDRVNRENVNLISLGAEYGIAPAAVFR